jgi:hypothetical protein
MQNGEGGIGGRGLRGAWWWYYRFEICISPGVGKVEKIGEIMEN